MCSVSAYVPVRVFNTHLIRAFFEWIILCAQFECNLVNFEYTIGFCLLFVESPIFCALFRLPFAFF